MSTTTNIEKHCMCCNSPIYNKGNTATIPEPIICDYCMINCELLWVHKNPTDIKKEKEKELMDIINVDDTLTD